MGELWRERELRYQMSDDCPPEIVRRVAIYRADWERVRDASVGWTEAKERAEQLWQQRDRRREYVATERGDYVIDNLLGTYFHAERRRNVSMGLRHCTLGEFEFERLN